MEIWKFEFVNGRPVSKTLVKENKNYKLNTLLKFLQTELETWNQNLEACKRKISN